MNHEVKRFLERLQDMCYLFSGKSDLNQRQVAPLFIFKVSPTELVLLRGLTVRKTFALELSHIRWFVTQIQGSPQSCTAFPQLGITISIS